MPVRNAGPSAATAVRLDDALPAPATVVHATTTLGTCDVAASLRFGPALTPALFGAERRG